MNDAIMKAGKRPNAVRAERKGYFTKDTVEEQLLCEQGFTYPKSFFQWQFKENYSYIVFYAKTKDCAVDNFNLIFLKWRL